MDVRLYDLAGILDRFLAQGCTLEPGTCGEKYLVPPEGAQALAPFALVDGSWLAVNRVPEDIVKAWVRKLGVDLNAPPKAGRDPAPTVEPLPGGPAAGGAGETDGVF